MYLKIFNFFLRRIDEANLLSDNVFFSTADFSYKTVFTFGTGFKNERNRMKKEKETEKKKNWMEKKTEMKETFIQRGKILLTKLKFPNVISSILNSVHNMRKNLKY